MPTETINPPAQIDPMNHLCDCGHPKGMHWHRAKVEECSLGGCSCRAYRPAQPDWQEARRKVLERSPDAYEYEDGSIWDAKGERKLGVGWLSAAASLESPSCPGCEELAAGRNDGGETHSEGTREHPEPVKAEQAAEDGLPPRPECFQAKRLSTPHYVEFVVSSSEAYHFMDLVQAEVSRLTRELEEAQATSDDFEQKGKELCAVLGNLAIHIHDLGLRKAEGTIYKDWGRYNARAESAEKERDQMAALLKKTVHKSCEVCGWSPHRPEWREEVEAVLGGEK